MTEETYRYDRYSPTPAMVSERLKALKSFKNFKNPLRENSDRKTKAKKQSGF
jgi:hypothetical protein